MDQAFSGGATLTRRGGLLLVAALGATGCVDLRANDPGLTIWETQLAAELAYPDFSGEAAALSDRSGTVIGIAIRGATTGAHHVWGLRLNDCAAPGQQVGSDVDYPELVVSAGDTASVETILGARLVGGGAYHVAVRVSASDTSRVACGDLVAR